MNGTLSTLLPDLADANGVRRGWVSRLGNWVVEARSHRVICLVMGLWILNGFDLAFTILSHHQGLLHEENPLARHMLSQGTASIALFKIGMVFIGSYPLLRFRTARISEMASLLLVAAYVVLAVRWSTYYELYTMTIPHGVDLAHLRNLTAMPTR